MSKAFLWSAVALLVASSFAATPAHATGEPYFSEDWATGFNGWTVAGNGVSSNCTMGMPACSVRLGRTSNGYSGSLSKNVNISLAEPTLVSFQIHNNMSTNTARGRAGIDLTLDNGDVIGLRMRSFETAGLGANLSLNGTRLANSVWFFSNGWASVSINLDASTGAMSMFAVSGTTTRLLEGNFSTSAQSIRKIAITVDDRDTFSGDLQAHYFVDALRIAPSPPVPLDLQVARGNRTLPVSWNPPSGGWDGSYWVQDVGGLGALVAGTTYAAIGLPANATKSYRVAAHGAFGPGFFTSAIQNRTYAAPTAPLGVSAVRGAQGGEIDVSWSSPSSDGDQPIQGYRLSCSCPSVQTGAEARTATLRGLQPNVTYQVYVYAFSAAGEGPASNGAAAKTHGLPSRALSLAAVPGVDPHTIRLSWDPPGWTDGLAVVDYTVLRSVPGTSTSYIPLTGIQGPTYLDTGLQGGQSYSYYVRPRTTAGTATDWGAIVQATAPAIPPSEPLAVSLVRGPIGGSLDATWQPPQDAGDRPVTGYRLELTTCNCSTPTPLDVGNVTSHRFTNLTTNTTHYLRVRAYSAIGAGAVAPVVAMRTHAPPTLVRELSAAAGPGAGEISISWLPPEGDGLPLEYVISRARGPGGPLEEIATTVTEGFHEDGLVPDEDYRYSVVARTSAGASAASEVEVTTLALPGAPSEPTAATGPHRGEVTFAWLPPSEPGNPALTHYEVAVGGSAGSLAVAAQTSSTSFVVDGRGDNETVWLAVRAVNDVGAGPWSVAVEGRTPTNPATVRNLSADGVEGNLTAIALRWDPPVESGALPLLTYEVYAFDESGNMTRVSVLPASERTWTASAPMPLRPARFAVAATNEVGVGAHATVCGHPWPASLVGIPCV